ncbi:MAG TPA: hypothetical protein H9837_08155 [Candidatus Brachybacterium merdigallinarum]|nr:hypothetical protein [Candidatus Brachybacterium merdigallinarum]
MESFDPDRFGQPGGALQDAFAPRHRPRRRAAGSVAGKVLREDAERQEVMHLRPDGQGLVEVRAASPSSRQPVLDEAQLLAALEVEGLRAAPSVLSLEDDGYVREAAPSQTPRRGRRSADDATPGTEERRAAAGARDDLEALISSLHARGWVLGAAPGQGLGIRSDGTVVVNDLSGLFATSGISPRLDDQLWIDSVLHDQQRTLKRRIDQLDPVPVPDGLPSPRPEADRERTTERGGLVPAGGAAETEGDGGSESSCAAEECREADERDGAERLALPRPRGAGRRMRGRWLGAPREILGQLTSRSRALLAGGVLLGGTLLGVGAWAMLPAPAPAPAAPDPVAVSVAPSIEDPRRVADELATARHAYVIGASDAPVSRAGSPAREQDDAVRAAYAELTVAGDYPVVHSAELVAAPDAEGIARLSIESSTPAQEVLTADGTARQLPETGTVRVELTVQWDGNAWQITRAAPA